MLALEGTPCLEHLRCFPSRLQLGEKEMGLGYVGALSAGQGIRPSGYEGWGWPEKGSLCGLRGKAEGFGPSRLLSLDLTVLRLSLKGRQVSALKRALKDWRSQGFLFFCPFFSGCTGDACQ